MTKETCPICYKKIEKRGLRLHMATHNYTDNWKGYFWSNPITSLLILWAVSEYLCSFFRSNTDSITAAAFNRLEAVIDHCLEKWATKT